MKNRTLSGDADAKDWQAFRKAVDANLHLSWGGGELEDAKARVMAALDAAEAAAQRGEPVPIDRDELQGMMEVQPVGELLRVVVQDLPPKRYDMNFVARATFALWSGSSPNGGNTVPRSVWTTAHRRLDLLADVRWTDDTYTDADGRQWRRVDVYGQQFAQVERWQAASDDEGGGSWQYDHPKEADVYRQDLRARAAQREKRLQWAQQALDGMSLRELEDERHDLVEALRVRHPQWDAQSLVDGAIENRRDELARAPAEREAMALAEAERAKIGSNNVVGVIPAPAWPGRSTTSSTPNRYVGGSGSSITVEPTTQLRRNDGRGMPRYDAGIRILVDGKKVDGGRLVYLTTEVPAAVLSRFRGVDPAQIKKVRRKGKDYFVHHGWRGSTAVHANGRKVGGKLADELHALACD